MGKPNEILHMLRVFSVDFSTVSRTRINFVVFQITKNNSKISSEKVDVDVNYNLLLTYF